MADGAVMSGEQAGYAACALLLGGEPGPLRSLLHTHHPVVPALRHDQMNKRPSDRLQLLSWNPRPLQVVDPSLLARSAYRKARAFATTSLWQRTSTWLPSTPALCTSTRTPLSPTTRVLLFIPCKLRNATWAVEGMVVAGNFRRAPDKSSPDFTVANVHTNNERAMRSSVCFALLLLIRDLCLKFGAAVLTGDLNKGVERELLSALL